MSVLTKCPAVDHHPPGFCRRYLPIGLDGVVHMDLESEARVGKCSQVLGRVPTINILFRLKTQIELITNQEFKVA